MRLRLHCCGLLAALALAGALGGCANVDFDSQQAWFSKPLDLTGRNAGGYTFSELAETKQRQRLVTANDLVDSKGVCPAPAAPQPAPGNQAPAASPPGSLPGGGIALGMSECEVVARAGQPSGVEIGRRPNGDRTAVLSFAAGPRPGIYRFTRGALTQMDRVEQAAPVAETDPSKKKAAKGKPQKNGDQT